MTIEDEVTKTDHTVPEPFSEAEKFAIIVRNLLADSLAPFLRELFDLKTKVISIEARLDRVEAKLFGNAAE
jgi:hypothetical protein